MSDVKLLNKDYLRSQYAYYMGDMYHLAIKNCKCMARPIGTKRKSGHVYVQIKGYVFNVRDVTWVWHYGPVPPSGLRYKDGVPGNNQIDNIVPVNPAEWVSFL